MPWTIPQIRPVGYVITKANDWDVIVNDLQYLKDVLDGVQSQPVVLASGLTVASSGNFEDFYLENPTTSGSRWVFGVGNIGLAPYKMGIGRVITGSTSGIGGGPDEMLLMFVHDGSNRQVQFTDKAGTVLAAFNNVLGRFECYGDQNAILFRNSAGLDRWLVGLRNDIAGNNNDLVIGYTGGNNGLVTITAPISIPFGAGIGQSWTNVTVGGTAYRVPARGLSVHWDGTIGTTHLWFHPWDYAPQFAIRSSLDGATWFTISGNLGSVNSVHFYPLASATYDLGSTTARWRVGYLDRLVVGNTAVDPGPNNLQVQGGLAGGAAPRVVIPPASMALDGGGAPTLVQTSTPTRYYLYYPDGSTTAANAQLHVPANYVSGRPITFRLWWFGETATSGATRWSIRAHARGVGGNVTPALTEVAATNATTGGTAASWNETVLQWSSSLPSPDQVLDLQVARIGADAGDTMTGNACLGLLVVEFGS